MPAKLGESSRSGSVGVALVTAVVCLPILAAAVFIGQVRHDETDGWLYRYMGHQLVHGQVLYVDLWNNKPPLCYWLNALAEWLSGGSMYGPAVLCGAAIVGVAASFYSVCRRLYGSAAASVATVVAVSHLYHQYFHVGGDRPSTFFVLAEVLAVLWYVRGFEVPERAGRRMVVAGVFSAAGFCLKQSVVGVAVAVVVHQLYRLVRGEVGSADDRGPGVWRVLVCFCVGWALMVGVVVVGLALTSDLGWAWDAVFGFNSGQFDAGRSVKRMSRSLIGMREVVDGLALPLILAVALAVYGLLFAWRGRDDGRGEVREGRSGTLIVSGWALFLWVWQLVAFAAVTIGPGRRVHYWAVALLPLMMLAGYAVHLVMESGRVGGGRPRFHVAVAVVWFGYMLFGPLAAQWRAVHVYHYHYVEGDDSRYRRVAEIVEANSEPGASVFVWGYDPRMYWELGRPAGARYMVMDQLMNPGPAAVELFGRVVESVEEGSPEILVMDESQLAKMEAGDWQGGRMTGAGEFAGWVRSNYVVVGGDGSGTVWRMGG